jgi:hypothetical protein
MQNNEWIENLKCHLYIPQPKKNIYVLNIIIQNLPEKRRNEGKEPQRNIQNPSNILRMGIEIWWRWKPLKGTLKETK